MDNILSIFRRPRITAYDIYIPDEVEAGQTFEAKVTKKDDPREPISGVRVKLAEYSDVTDVKGVAVLVAPAVTERFPTKVFIEKEGFRGEAPIDVTPKPPTKIPWYAWAIPVVAVVGAGLYYTKPWEKTKTWF